MTVTVGHTAATTENGGLPDVSASRTFSVKFEEKPPYSPDDPVVYNMGTQHVDEATGLKVSPVMEVSHWVNDGLADHGDHETRIGRTNSGTYMAVVTGGHYTEGKEQSDYYRWEEAAIIKVTADGVKTLYTFEYPYTSAANPNVIIADDSTVYVTVLADDKPAYMQGIEETATVTYEGVWMQVFTIDTATDTVTASPISRQPYEFIRVHGYGYTQPFYDEKAGKIYAIYPGGEEPGYTEFFTYDIEKGEWLEGGVTRIFPQGRTNYQNVYSDGNGGIVFVCGRGGQYGTIESIEGANFNTNPEGYTLDKCVVIHVPDLTDPDYDAYEFYDTLPPDYSFNAKGFSKIYSTSHFKGGCTYLDTEGRIHIFFKQSAGGKIKTYHYVFDKNLNIVKGEQFQFPTTSQQYSLNLLQNTDGVYYLLASNMSPNSTDGRTLKLEIWTSTDGLNFTRTVEPFEILDKDGNTFAPDNFMIANVRSRSIVDNNVPVLFSIDGTYYYFAIELPHTDADSLQQG